MMMKDNVIKSHKNYIGKYIRSKGAIGQIIRYTKFPMFPYEVKWIKYSKYYPNLGSGFFNTYYYNDLNENDFEIITRDEVIIEMI